MWHPSCVPTVGLQALESTQQQSVSERGARAWTETSPNHKYTGRQKLGLEAWTLIRTPASQTRILSTGGARRNLSWWCTEGNQSNSKKSKPSSTPEHCGSPISDPAEATCTFPNINTIYSSVYCPTHYVQHSKKYMRQTQNGKKMTYCQETK